jgi:hypothetical protein
VFTVDHINEGKLRLDLKFDWQQSDSPAPITPQEDLISDPDASWLWSAWECGLDPVKNNVQWLVGGPNCLLAVQNGMLVEYDLGSQSPVGVVAFLNEGEAGGFGKWNQWNSSF